MLGIGVFIFAPWLLWLWGVVALLAWAVDRSLGDSNWTLSTCTVAWALIVSTPAGSRLLLPPVSLIATAITLLAVHLIRGPVIRSTLLVVWIALLSMQFAAGAPMSIPAGNSQGAYAFQIQPALAHVTQVQHGTPTRLVLVGSTGVTPSPATGRRTLILAEHDPPNDAQVPAILGGQLRQPEPWGQSRLVGQDILMAAIGQDQMLVANVGTNLGSPGTLLLAGVCWTEGAWASPLILQDGDMTIVFDSDMFVNKLAPYQTALLGVLIGSAQALHGIALLAALALATLRARRMRSYVGAAVVLLTLLAAIAMPVGMSTTGEVRIVGDGPRGWPHSAGGVSGVLRSLAEHGFCVRRGARGATLLVVAEGSAELDHEHVVVLLPGASVIIGDEVLECRTDPLGESNGIPDARTIEWNHQRIAGVASVQGVLVIGTGSPARLDWTRLLSEALPRHSSGG